MRGRAALCFVVLSGCSLVFPVTEYDEGTSSSSTGGASSGGQAQGGGGAGANGGGGAGGAGGAPECAAGGFANPPVSEVSSDFDAGLGDGLALLNCAQVVGGEVQVHDVDGIYCWFYTTGDRRLTCDTITFHLLDEGYEEGGVQRFIYIRQTQDVGDLQILQESHGFSFGPIPLDIDSFSLPEDAWWRLSADADDVLTFETSADGESWTLRGSGPSPFPLDSVTVEIGAGNYGGIPDPGVARFDCFNVAPPCP